MEPIRPRPPGRGRSNSAKKSGSQGGRTERRGFENLLVGGIVGDQEASEVGGPGKPIVGTDAIDRSTEQLFDAVHVAGQRLADEQTYSAAQQYREAVRAFVARIVPEANSVHIAESGLSMVSRKRYFLLTEINRSVERLLSGLLSTQSPQLDILSRLEEINGLLVDLRH